MKIVRVISKASNYSADAVRSRYVTLRFWSGEFLLQEVGENQDFDLRQAIISSRSLSPEVRAAAKSRSKQAFAAVEVTAEGRLA
jgi:hypothetical protein